jgi:hypothetical protein
MSPSPDTPWSAMGSESLAQEGLTPPHERPAQAAGKINGQGGRTTGRFHYYNNSVDTCDRGDEPSIHSIPHQEKYHSLTADLSVPAQTTIGRSAPAGAASSSTQQHGSQLHSESVIWQAVNTSTAQPQYTNDKGAHNFYRRTTTASRREGIYSASGAVTPTTTTKVGLEIPAHTTPQNTGNLADTFSGATIGSLRTQTSSALHTATLAYMQREAAGLLDTGNMQMGTEEEDSVADTPLDFTIRTGGHISNFYRRVETGGQTNSALTGGKGSGYASARLRSVGGRDQLTPSHPLRLHKEEAWATDAHTIHSTTWPDSESHASASPSIAYMSVIQPQSAAAIQGEEFDGYVPEPLQIPTSVRGRGSMLSRQASSSHTSRDTPSLPTSGYRRQRSIARRDSSESLESNLDSRQDRRRRIEEPQQEAIPLHPERDSSEESDERPPPRRPLRSNSRTISSLLSRPRTL